jgi:hypothetical protein
MELLVDSTCNILCQASTRGVSIYKFIISSLEAYLRDAWSLFELALYQFGSPGTKSQQMQDYDLCFGRRVFLAVGSSWNWM